MVSEGDADGRMWRFWGPDFYLYYFVGDGGHAERRVIDHGKGNCLEENLLQSQKKPNI